MEWVLPLQKLEVGNIVMSTPHSKDSSKQKPLAPLAYRDGSHYSLPSLSLLLPPLPISSYDPHSGRLELDTSALHIISMKLQTLQETVLNAIQYNQTSWFDTSYGAKDIRDGFQHILENMRFIVYCPLPTDGREGVYANGIPYFSGGVWRQMKANDLTVGKKVRVAVKIHGISFLLRGDQKWAGRSRIQHRILGVIAQA
jgi:hypothetical protein